MSTTPPSNRGDAPDGRRRARASVRRRVAMRAMTNQSHHGDVCCPKHHINSARSPAQSPELVNACTAQAAITRPRLGLLALPGGRGLLGVVGTFCSGTDGSVVARIVSVLQYAKMGWDAQLRESHGTRSERSHRSPDMSFSSVITMTFHRYSLVTVVFAPMGPTSSLACAQVNSCQSGPLFCTRAHNPHVGPTTAWAR